MNDLIQKGAILLISGPSGCGKSTLLKAVYKSITNYYFSISTTTRAPRVGEQDGVDYFFTTKEDFQNGISQGNFLEWAQVHGNFYGTSLIPIQKALQENKLVIFDIDVQGFEQVRKQLANITTTVFITTPSLKELETRLISRGTDPQEVIQKRLTNAKKEIEYIDQYDYLIINDNLEIASKQLVAIAISALSKSSLFECDKIKKVWFE
ncbi:MAG: guanylate kinase [Campylobacterales bacterium]|nr:guanylate kinase [Campylobacterales bacterium]